MSNQGKRYDLAGAALEAAKTGYAIHLAACKKLQVEPELFDEWAADFERHTPEQLKSEPADPYQPERRYYQYAAPREKI